jgi:hypothetical protein
MAALNILESAFMFQKLDLCWQGCKDEPKFLLLEAPKHISLMRRKACDQCLYVKIKNEMGGKQAKAKEALKQHSPCEKKMCGTVRGSPQNSHTKISKVCSHSSNFEMGKQLFWNKV